MALKLTIRPGETVFVNGAEICNSGSATSLVIKNHCRILRESEMVSERDVYLPCSRLAFVLQQIVLKENPFEELNELSKLAIQILQKMPAVAPQILEIQNLLSEKKAHMAFKKGKALMALEAAEFGKAEAS
ncbi:flagellar biosynthesis repressor FlbT [Methylobacterium sp. E-045]|uniref:flagellar biosynthesis repressor FlbT n=1 Tax=Methylobacterium sp. E-045 TaxID=2836575 RepID=UPI001FB86C23|nr:flagellar biosynthesis repressor FlbT [Methylobacterium sp. E-045]MCJ2127390.1 flagellar biosynthesis repressor FlbT [Methylobacterium sp. E-045]